MPRIYVKEYNTTVNFPDDMDANEIRSVLASKFPSKSQPERPTEIAVPEWAKEAPTLYGALGATAEVGGPIAEAVGLGAGGILGAPSGPVGTVGGAGLGYAAGKNLRDFLEELVGKRPVTTIGQELSELPAEIAAGMTYEMMGQAAGKSVEVGLKKILQPFKQSITPGLTNAERELQKAGGIGFSPAQKTDNAIVDTLEEVAEKSFTGSQTFKKFRLQNERGFNSYVQSVTDKISGQASTRLGAEETGILLRDTLEGGANAFNAAGRALYKNVDELTGGVYPRFMSEIVDMTPLQSMASKIQAEQQRGVVTSGKLNTILDNILNKRARVSFEDAQMIRSDLLAVTRQIDELVPGRAEGAAKRLASIMDRSMEDAARNLSGDALGAWRAANKFWKQGKETFNNKFVKNLMKQLENEPAIVINKIFQNGRPAQIRRIKGMVNEKTWNTLKSGYLEKLLLDSTSVDGQILGKSFLGKLKKAGDPVLNETFTGSELAKIRNIGTIANTIQKPIGGGGGMLIQLTQAAAIVGLFFGQTEKAAPFLLGPYAIAKLMTHPKGHALFAQGLKTPVRSPQAVNIATKIGAIVSEIGVEEPLKEKGVDLLGIHRLPEVKIPGVSGQVRQETPRTNRLRERLSDFRVAN